MATQGYKIIDEIEPVTDRSWALHPKLTFFGSMMLPTLWLAIIGAANSFALGHPRRKHHAAVAASAVMAVWSIIFVAGAYMPEPTWKYFSLGISVVRLWLAYYLTEEQQWAAEMFAHAGGKVLSLWTTLGILRVIALLVATRVSERIHRAFLRMVP